MDIRNMKGKTPIVCLTAYTHPVAEILDIHTDILLVGDSLGMVLYGMESTLPVTLDMMCNHGKAVTKAAKKSCVVVDMPFGSYQKSPAEAFENAARIIAETGCDAVKFEGGLHMAETIEFLVQRGIPVMAHVGLLPQSVNADGGYRYHGKTEKEKQKIIEDALAVEKAGAFAVVIEGVTESLANEITAKLKIPTIGIGASAACDGQVLVVDDMAGMFGDDVPKFVKTYGNMREVLENAASNFADDVRARKFPGKDQTFDLKITSDKNKSA